MKKLKKKTLYVHKSVLRHGFPTSASIFQYKGFKVRVNSFTGAEYKTQEIEYLDGFKSPLTSTADIVEMNDKLIKRFLSNQVYHEIRKRKLHDLEEELKSI